MREKQTWEAARPERFGSGAILPFAFRIKKERAEADQQSPDERDLNRFDDSSKRTEWLAWYLGGMLRFVGVMPDRDVWRNRDISQTNRNRWAETQGNSAMTAMEKAKARIARTAATGEFDLARLK